MGSRFWVVEWTEHDTRLHTYRFSWHDAVQWALKMAERHGCQVRVMSDTTHLGDS